ncbi:hypothetical protein PN441_18565 [Spirulina major CS-329]|nr:MULTISPECIES: hypothetical protein [Spirulina]MDB9493504.1 hypothetical protein [Spirulina subsalsa CS-330]MDB9505086.1 hypothetical protein [Spirulina major CS-329]
MSEEKRGQRAIAAIASTPKIPHTIPKDDNADRADQTDPVPRTGSV